MEIALNKQNGCNYFKLIAYNLKDSYKLGELASKLASIGLFGCELSYNDDCISLEFDLITFLSEVTKRLS